MTTGVDQTAVVPQAATRVLELRATNLQTIAEELTYPTSTTADLTVETADRLPSVVRTNWSHLQAVTAAAITAGRPVTTEPEVSHYIAAVIRHHSYRWERLEHAAANIDATRFRSDLTDNVGPVLGIELTAGLVRRPMATLTSDTHPYYGWATRQELAEMLSSVDNNAVPSREDQTFELHTFLMCARAAVTHNLDLVTVYA